MKNLQINTAFVFGFHFEVGVEITSVCAGSMCMGEGAACKYKQIYIYATVTVAYNYVRVMSWVYTMYVHREYT